MPVRLSYINQRGNEIILDDDAHSFLGELAGREGFEAPEVGLTRVVYGDGSEEVLSTELKSRELTCYFWAESLDDAFENDFDALKMGLVQVGKKNQDTWGCLKVLKRNGEYVYIDCVYSEGLESSILDSPVRRSFHLTFTASDPYFYSEETTDRVISTFSDQAYLHFGSSFFFGSGTHFRSSGTLHTETVTLDCHRAYPTITITGPARNLLLRNVDTGKVIEFLPDFELLAGEDVTLYTMRRKRSAVWHRYDGSVQNASRYLTAESSLDWFLEFGENVLQYRNSDNNEVSLCTLSYRPGWLSGI